MPLNALSDTTYNGTIVHYQLVLAGRWRGLTKSIIIQVKGKERQQGEKRILFF